MTPRDQNGAALIVSLIILLVLTLLGVASMQTTTLEERMAGNLRDTSVSFEAAEAGLRSAEGYLESEWNYDPDFYYALDGEPRPSYAFHYDDAPEDRLPVRREQLTAEALYDVAAVADDVPMQDNRPLFWIEQLQHTPPCRVPETPCPHPLIEDDLFRIVVFATGNNPQTITFLESEFRPE